MKYLIFVLTQRKSLIRMTAWRKPLPAHTAGCRCLRSRQSPSMHIQGPESGYYEGTTRSEELTSELQSRPHLVCRLLLEKKKEIIKSSTAFNSSLRSPSTPRAG